MCHAHAPTVAAPAWRPRPGGRGRGVRAHAHAPDRSQLQQDLEAAVAVEDYEAAARLKRQLEEAEAADPVLSLQRALAAAVEEERYKDAAELRRQLDQATLLATGPEALESLLTSSNQVTHGVRVHAQAHYLRASSQPAAGRYVWGYTIIITNESDQVVQLRSRHWVITDQDGMVSEVRGPGVVGAQPVLLPGKSFQYTSGCPLRTPNGSMVGTYSFSVLDEKDGHFKETLEVNIGRFKLTTDDQRI